MSQRPQRNEIERRRWNDPYWSSVWPRREALTGVVTELLIDRAALAPGERVLDVGSGAGIASFAAAAVVGPEGSVLGADVSSPLVAYASALARDRGVQHVSFVEADVQLDALGTSPFDVAISQFGVMFFDDPHRAFANVACHVAPGGRLAFACWQPLEDNSWHLNHALKEFLPPLRNFTPDGVVISPFSLGDPRRTASLLEAGGWASIRIEPLVLPASVPRDALYDEGQLASIGIAAEQRSRAASAVEEHLLRFRQPDGQYRVELAVHLVTATR